MARVRLDTLQVGRGLAALAVVLFHSAGAATASAGPMPGVSPALSFGYLGVDFFFVLSGFIILHAHGADPKTIGAALTFARKRALRIYVPYLPIGILVALVFLFVPGLTGAPKGWSVFTSLTLIQFDGPPALTVAWTLVREVAFYAIFLLFYATRRFGWLVGAWAIALVLSGLLHPALPASLGIILDPIDLEFIFGMAACLAYRSLRPRGALIAIAVGAFGIVVFLIAHPTPPDLRVLFGLGVAVLLVGVAALDRAGRLHSWRPAVFLGDASYALYLVHYPAISVALKLAKHLSLSWWSVLLLNIIAALVAAVAYHLAFERPVTRFLSNAFRKRHDLTARPVELA